MGHCKKCGTDFPLKLNGKCIICKKQKQMQIENVHWLARRTTQITLFPGDAISFEVDNKVICKTEARRRTVITEAGIFEGIYEGRRMICATLIERDKK